MRYSVKVALKKSDHPWYNQGSGLAYTFNDREGETLRLVKGETYTFDIDTPGHPFYFTTDSTGGQGDLGSLMGPGETATDKGVLVFKVRNDLPSKFYFQCQIHPKMGGKVTLIDKTNSINVNFDEERRAKLGLVDLCCNV